MRPEEKFDLKPYNCDVRKRYYITPETVALKQGEVTDERYLVKECGNQITLSDPIYTKMITTKERHAAVVLDFGKEFRGSIKLMIKDVRNEDKTARLHIRFGESLAEALTPLGRQGTTNDHGNRDFEMEVKMFSANETNESGFRYVFIELLTETELDVKAVKGVFMYRDCDIVGSFQCSDDRLNKIWDTAFYTVFLNMQNYLWDGIKRDCLVWIGDMHTEVRTIMTAIGDHEIIRQSLDLVRNSTPDGHWMNNICSYSMWWLIIQHEYYMMFGDYDYLEQQRPTIEGLLQRLISTVGDDGREEFSDGRFIDWPTSGNEEAIHAGLQAMLKICLDIGSYLMRELGNKELANECAENSDRLMTERPYHGGSKEAAALLALAGMASYEDMNTNVIEPGGAHGYSTFFGYYILKTKALAGDMEGALRDIRDYWGGMLDMGATTFWEDFNLDWMEGSYGIDKFPVQGQKSIHGDYGDYCYKGFRHSLCHGWASGPCPFLSEYVLGVKKVGPCEYIIKPDLGDLSWAKGTYPAEGGVINVFVEKKKNGKLRVTAKAPSGVKCRIEK